MPNVTENYGLKKPLVDEFYDINVQNENMDVIDAKLKEIAESSSDASGQINEHDKSNTAHADIRTAVNEAKQSASQSLLDAKSYTDQKIAAIPTPDVSGQIGTHNTSTSAHADIRTAVSTAQSTANDAKTAAANALSVANGKANASHAHTASEVGALPIEGGTLTGTELGINNNRGKLVANGNMFRMYATEDPSDTNNQRYLSLYSQFFKEDVSESLKLIEKVNGVDTSYKIYGEHNITSGTTDLTAGTSELPSGHIYFVYE